MNDIELIDVNDTKLIDEIVKRAEEHQKQREKEFAIAELEKLEEKIIRNSRPYREKLVIDVYTCQILIRKEITELKGEGNEKPE